ncbi:hypothetical protein M5689_006341 [Euphorbia peplus]|nr:hypothetical protein M5689_006341 [Euphorbia peplus]
MIEVPMIELLSELFPLLEFPPPVKTLTIATDGRFCSCIHLPQIKKAECVYPPTDFYGRSPESYADATNIAATKVLKHLVPLYDLQISDFSSVQVAEFETRKQLLNVAETRGYATVEALNHKYVLLKDLHSSIMQIFHSVTTLLTGTDTQALSNSM